LAKATASRPLTNAKQFASSWGGLASGQQTLVESQPSRDGLPPVRASRSAAGLREISPVRGLTPLRSGGCRWPDDEVQRRRREGGLASRAAPAGLLRYSPCRHRSLDGSLGPTARFRSRENSTVAEVCGPCSGLHLHVEVDWAGREVVDSTHRAQDVRPAHFGGDFHQTIRCSVDAKDLSRQATVVRRCPMAWPRSCSVVEGRARPPDRSCGGDAADEALGAIGRVQRGWPPVSRLLVPAGCTGGATIGRRRPWRSQ